MRPNGRGLGSIASVVNVCLLLRFIYLFYLFFYLFLANTLNQSKRCLMTLILYV